MVLILVGVLLHYYTFKGYCGMDKLDAGKIGIQSLIGTCPKTNMETKCQGRTHSQNQYVLMVQYSVVLVLVGVLFYYYSFQGYYDEDKLDDGKIGIQSLISRCPKTNMETKCQGKAHSQNQYVLIVQYSMVLVLVGVLFYYYSFKGYYGEDKLDDGKIGIQNLIGRCPITNMETKCQGKAHSQNQDVLILWCWFWLEY